MWSSRSHESPLVIEGSEEVIVQEVNLEDRVESDPSVDEKSVRMKIPSPSTPTCRKLRLFT
jgi:hypothetical protein